MTSTDACTSFTPRSYQVELLEEALKKNTIVCLGTGTGKTFIAVLLIKEFVHTVIKPFDEGGQRIIFIVPSVALVEQQADNVEKHTALKVGQYVGAMGVDFWDKEVWHKELQKYEVLVMTAQILVNTLNCGFIRLQQISLLVIDECHRAVKNHPYSQVLGCFNKCKFFEQPHVLGLTASVITAKCKPESLEENIKALEIMLRSRCVTTRDETAVREYGTNPEEELLQFSSMESYYSKATSTLQAFEEEMRDCDEFIIQKQLKKSMSDCQHVLVQLGPWALQKETKLVTAYITQLKVNPLVASSESTFSVLMSCEDVLKRSLEQCQLVKPPRSCLRLGELVVSQKAKHLLLYLKKNYSNETTDVVNFCAIVFVERRSTARLLCELILQAVESDADMKFLKPQWTVGAGGIALPAADTSEARPSYSRQNRVLRDFRSGRSNLLVSTSATEEGLDIPSCSLVIQFDPPKEVRAYIQAKGRARRRDSKYVVMAEKLEVEQIDDQLEDFRAIEKTLAQICIDREMPTQEEIEDKQKHLPEYCTRAGARVTMASGIDLINRYCDKLPGDHFTHLTPHCEVYEEELGKRFVAELALPRSSPYKAVLKSTVWSSKMKAKQHVALLMCKKLHEVGQLNDHLCPVLEDSSDCDEDDENEDEANDDIKQQGDSRKLYKMKVPEILKDCRPMYNRPVYLYQIDVKAVSTKDSCRSPVNCLGILISKPISSALPHFNLYSKSGEVCVKLQQQHSVGKISLSVYKQIDQWHEKLFNHIIGIRKCTSLCFSESVESRGYRIVPLLNSGEGDWVLDMKLLSSCEVELQKLPNVQLKQQESELVGCVVRRTYLLSEKTQFRVVAIRHDLTPSSKFPDVTKADTYSDYFSRQYGLKIKDMAQPLLEVESLSWKINALRVERKSRDSQRIQLVPELCSVDPLPADIWDSGLLVPSVLWRFEQLLVAEELRTAIAMQDVYLDEHKSFSNAFVSPMKKKKLSDEVVRSARAVTKQHKDVNSDWVVLDDSHFDCDSSSCDSMDVEDGELESSEGDHDEGVPSVFNVLTALTAKSSDDSFNLERLEMLGDAFLKQAISISLFWKYINKHEGQLSKKRSRIVCNRNLFALACKKNLPLYMFVTAFRPLDMWLPPGFEQLSAVVHAEAADKPVEYRKQKMSNKCVADCVEALIGAYLVHGGYSAALHFMKWIGIDTDPSVSIALNAQSLEVSECIGQISSVAFHSDSTSRKKRTVETLSSGFDRLENSIGYEFKDKRWLLQALTHPSYHYNLLTDSYQRLEFLGDALIDYLVTRKIYCDYPDMSPGKLTDIRSALVCNDTFAEIAVKQNYHHHLKEMSPKLFKVIDLYAESQKKGEVSSRDIDADTSSLMEYSIDDIADKGDDDDHDNDEVEAPKVLGDIFESVAGAIFLDCGLDVEIVWKVYSAMLKPYILKYGRNPPIQPVRQLHEMFSDGLKFSPCEKERDGRLACTVTLPCGRAFTGVARNGKLARIAASKKALRYLETKKRES